jgi:mannose-6-phosphate isomerase
MPDEPLYPLIFEPYLRPMPWGGRRLERWLDKPLPPAGKIGEAWLLSDHRLHVSQVANGPLTGISLRDLMTYLSEELLGFKAERFPLLIKLLDAQENLSIQVHPDDALAKHLAPKEGGKTEAWIVLECTGSSAIYLGLKKGVSRATLVREIAGGNVPNCLHRFHPGEYDCFFVPAGTIHALGGGLVVFEVQQTSDATFRIYDWGRVDAAGNPRALQIEAGLACLDEHSGGFGLYRPAHPERPGGRLVECGHFHMAWRRPAGPTNLQGFSLIFIVQGNATLAWGQETLPVRPGRIVLLPHDVEKTVLMPESSCRLVEITLPPAER